MFTRFKKNFDYCKKRGEKQLLNKLNRPFVLSIFKNEI